MVHESTTNKIKGHFIRSGRRSTSSKTAGKNDFSGLIVFSGYKKIVFQNLVIRHITWFSKKYSIIPSGAEDRQNRQNPLESTISLFYSSSVSKKKIVQNSGPTCPYMVRWRTTKKIALFQVERKTVKIVINRCKQRFLSFICLLCL